MNDVVNGGDWKSLNGLCVAYRAHIRWQFSNINVKLIWSCAKNWTDHVSPLARFFSLPALCSIKIMWNRLIDGSTSTKRNCLRAMRRIAKDEERRQLSIMKWNVRSSTAHKKSKVSIKYSCWWWAAARSSYYNMKIFHPDAIKLFHYYLYDDDANTNAPQQQAQSEWVKNLGWWREWRMRSGFTRCTFSPLLANGNFLLSLSLSPFNCYGKENMAGARGEKHSR